MLRSAKANGDVVVLTLEDGEVALHRHALRDACPCPDCRHPVSGQRLFETWEETRTAELAGAVATDDALRVMWNDGHESVFPAEWLAAEATAARTGERPSRPVKLWGIERRERLPLADYAEVVDDAAARRRWLADVAELGFAVLRGAPRLEGTVTSVAELFGHVRVTNYGRIFDVRVKSDATNLADTSLGLSLHTDNAYRVPTPTVQLLHCIASDVDGGETVVADGFRAVAQLRAASREVLSTVRIRFAYRDENADLEADVPVVELDHSGRPLALHVNNRSKGVPAGSPELVARWYQAYFELLARLESAEAQVRLRLDPGDVLIFDNLRVLHGRTGFSGVGERHLQGCYADRDALFSTLAVLERRETP